MARAKAAHAKPRKSEQDIRKACIKRAKMEGWYHLRLHFGPGAARGVPDDLFIRDARFLFVEFKAEGKARNLSPIQKIVHASLRAHGADVRVIDNVDTFAFVTLDPVIDTQ